VIFAVNIKNLNPDRKRKVKEGKVSEYYL